MEDPESLTPGEQLGIRFNQILGLFDRSPLATAICHADGLKIRVANPAFAHALGVPRAELRGAPMLDLVTPDDPRSITHLHNVIRRGASERTEIAVHWETGSGRVSFELVDDALIGDLPLLTYLHVDTVAAAAPEIDPVAAAILEMIAAGETTAAVARVVGLTADGVNYHLARLSRRFDAQNRTALVARAYALGVLDAAVWPPRVK